MVQPELKVTPWQGETIPNEARLLGLMVAEGLLPYRWSNAPGDFYSPHTHPYHKILYVVAGSITFGLLSMGMELTLNPGDRLDLPPETAHNALVGSEGVVCLEAYRK